MSEQSNEQALEIGEGPVSSAPGFVNKIIVCGAVVLAVAGIVRSLDLDRAAGLLLYTEQYLFAMLGTAFFLVFLHLGLDRKPRHAAQRAGGAEEKPAPRRHGEN